MLIRARGLSSPVRMALWPVGAPACPHPHHVSLTHHHPMWMCGVWVQGKPLNCLWSGRSTCVFIATLFSFLHWTKLLFLQSLKNKNHSYLLLLGMAVAPDTLTS